MEVGSILNEIKRQKENKSLSEKLFRYSGLIQAIEFFSQKLNFEQIIDAAFDFVNELLAIEESAIFVLQNNTYVLKKTKGYENAPHIIKDADSLQSLATLHGTLLQEQDVLLKYFDKEIVDSYHLSAVIPLIMENILYGFIFISNKTIGDLKSDDYIISESLMKLFNNALENYKRYEELNIANRELDERIFNLFAINQSSKALLSELNLDVLYSLSVDVFSELTQSEITSFFLFDEKSEKFQMLAYRNVLFRDQDLQLKLTLNHTASLDLNKVIINTSNDLDVLYFNSLFQEGLPSLMEVKPKYIVLMMKGNKIHGFVTLAETVTGFEYKNSVLELIESLSSSTYLAITNATYFKQVNEQKKLIQSKLENLISLNKLTKNINSSNKIETLLDMTMKTLEISFGMEKALIALYNKEKDLFTISKALNFKTNKKEIKITPAWKRVLEGDSVYDANEKLVHKYLGKVLVNDIGSGQGILLVPIYIERADIELLGVIIILKFSNKLINDEETILTLETVAGHIAPVISNLTTLEEHLRFLLPNYIELFKRDLKNDIIEAHDYFLDLEVIQVTDNRDDIFKKSNLFGKLQKKYKKIYSFSNNTVFIISNVKEENAEKNIRKITGIEDLSIKKMILGKDFEDFEGFFKQF